MGAVDPTFHNPAGIKTRDARGDRPEDHARFQDWEEGVTAHLDHLALYAGAPGYPRQDTPDPRHFTWIAGKAPTVEALGGLWAPSPDYGRSIVEGYLKPLLATEVPAPSAVPSAAPAPAIEEADPWAAEAWQKATAKGVLDGTRPRDPLTRQELAVVLERLGLLDQSVGAIAEDVRRLRNATFGFTP